MTPDRQVQILSSPLAINDKTMAVQEKFDLKQHLVQQRHYQESEIELEIGLHLISLNVVNARSSSISRKQRQRDASLLASTIETVIRFDHQFADVNAIHVNYTKRSKLSSKVIQGFDFFKLNRQRLS